MLSSKWTEEQLVELLKLYCCIPFGKIDSKNPQIIALAKKIARTSGAVAMKMANFASLDETIDRKGMSNYSKLDKIVWDKFISNIDYYLNDDVQTFNGFNDNNHEYCPDFEGLVGVDVESVVKTRIGQKFFREMILASYDGRCALSEIPDKQLLVASHIAPWATAADRRLDPRNGICLNAVIDRAFDQGLVTLSDDMTVLYATALSKTAQEKIRFISSKTLRLPSKFHPDRDLIRAHRERFPYTYTL
jgi:putative restriction endonuclease